MSLSETLPGKATAPQASPHITKDRHTAWILTAPALILMIVILLAPILIAALLSFTNYSLGNSGFDWVGTRNYEKLFTRSTYEKMFVATLTYVVTVVPISVGLGLGAAKKRSVPGARLQNGPRVRAAKTVRKSETEILR